MPALINPPGIPHLVAACHYRLVCCVGCCVQRCGVAACVVLASPTWPDPTAEAAFLLSGIRNKQRLFPIPVISPLSFLLSIPPTRLSLFVIFYCIVLQSDDFRLPPLSLATLATLLHQSNHGSPSLSLPNPFTHLQQTPDSTRLSFIDLANQHCSTLSSRIFRATTIPLSGLTEPTTSRYALCAAFHLLGAWDKPATVRHVLACCLPVSRLLHSRLYTMCQSPPSAEGQVAGETGARREGQNRIRAAWPVSTPVTVQHESILARRNQHGPQLTQEVCQ